MTRGRILAIDDDERILELYQSMFEEDYDIVLAPSVSDALDSIESGPFDLFIVDLDVSGVPGDEIIRMLRAKPDYRQTPILAISGYPELARRVNPYEVTTMIKPVHTDQLKEKVREALPSGQP